MTRNTSSSVTSEKGWIKNSRRPRRLEDHKERLQSKDGIFSSVSKFTLALIRSHISSIIKVCVLSIRFSLGWVARSETSKNLHERERGQRPKTRDQKTKERVGDGSITVGQAQGLFHNRPWVKEREEVYYYDAVYYLRTSTYNIEHLLQLADVSSLFNSVAPLFFQHNFSPLTPQPPRHLLLEESSYFLFLFMPISTSPNYSNDEASLASLASLDLLHKLSKTFFLLSPLIQNSSMALDSQPNLSGTKKKTTGDYQHARLWVDPSSSCCQIYSPLVENNQPPDWHRGGDQV